MSPCGYCKGVAKREGADVHALCSLSSQHHSLSDYESVSVSSSGAMHFAKQDGEATQLEIARITRILHDVVLEFAPIVAEHSVRVEEALRIEEERKQRWNQWTEHWAARCRKRACRLLDAATNATHPGRSALSESYPNSESGSEFAGDMEAVSAWMEECQISYVEEHAPMTTACGSRVVVIRTSMGQLVALKQVSAHNHSRELRNLRLLTGMQHVIQLAEAGHEHDKCGVVTFNNGETALATAYVDGIALAEAVMESDWVLDQCEKCVFGLVQAVVGLHDSGFIHGNIHSNAFLVHRARQTIVLVDMSHAVLDGEWTANVGMDGWRAPEVVRELDKGDSMRRRGWAAKALDVWALGVTVCCMGAAAATLGDRQNSIMVAVARAQEGKTSRQVTAYIHRQMQLTQLGRQMPAQNAVVWVVVQRALLLSASARDSVSKLLIGLQ